MMGQRCAGSALWTIKLPVVTQAMAPWGTWKVQTRIENRCMAARTQTHMLCSPVCRQCNTDPLNINVLLTSTAPPQNV